MHVERLGLHFQIDDRCLLVHIVDVVEETGCSSTTTDNDILKFCHLMEHVPFYLAEPFFATLLEDLPNGFAHTAGNIPVKVIELNVEFLCQRLADRGLAGSHVSYQDNAYQTVLQA